MTILLPFMAPTGGEGGEPPPPPPPPPPPRPSVTIVSEAINADCDQRLPGELPGIALTVTSSPPANIVGIEDASFEAGTGSADPTGCTLSSSAEEALDGTHSLKLVCTTEGATDSVMSVRLGPYAVIPGRVYTITANVRGGTPRTVELEGLYFDDDTLVESGGSTSFTDSDTEWDPSPPFLVLSAAPALATSLFIDISIEDPAGPLSAPAGLGVTPTGTTGSTVYSYVVTALNAYGETLPDTPVQITDGNAVLSSSNHNALSWSAVSGATDYRVYRGSPGDYGELPGEYATYADIWADLATYADILTHVGSFGFVAQTASTSYNDETNGPLGAAPPAEDTTGEPAFIDEVGGFASATVTEWSLAPPGTVTITRADGSYVQGASPLFPLTLDSTGQAQVTDWDAPYGLFATYIAVLSQFGKSEQPSLPSAPVQMGQAVDTCTLYERLGWAKDEDTMGLLEQWLAGIGQMLDRVDSISRDSYDTDGKVAPSWSTVLDINRCPTAALPWLGQFVGARLPTTLRDDEMRYEIENSPAWARGTPAAILAAANRYLLPSFSATLSERDSDPYSLTITVPDAGVVGDATYASITFGYATYADVLADFATYADLWAGVEAIEKAINGAIPAGLVATIDFV